MHPSFPEFLRDASWSSRTWLFDSIPVFQFSHRTDFLWGPSWDTQSHWIVSFNKATDPFPPLFFDFLLGCPPTSVCLKWHLSPYLHPVSDLWFMHSGRCHKSHDGSVHFPLWIFSRDFWPFDPERLAPRGLRFLWSFFPLVCVNALEVEEDDCAVWPKQDSWLKLRESPLERCPVAFHWKHSHTFLSSPTFLPLWLFWPICPSQCFHSRLWCCES